MNNLIVSYIIPAAMALLPPHMDSPSARAMLVASGLVESGFQHSTQVPAGPARGYWQFELVGVRQVMTHPRTRDYAQDVLDRLGHPRSARAVHSALADDHVLAAAFARLLLWTKLDPLPSSSAEGWRLYLSTWLPGKPRYDKWRGAWRMATR